ncbi:MAG: hypothetical protein M1840_003124 [Geoglossum simile]|nr:MAG: hypothetical protein M1840_003124 [Geoglossum simile]
MCCSDLFLVLIAILFPPLAVWVKRGICSADSLINIALSCLGYIPGLLHAWYIIAKYPEVHYELVPQDAEDGRVTYLYVSQHPHPQHHCHQDYGTTTAPSAPLPPQQSGVVSQPQPASGPSVQNSTGEGSSRGAALPTYAEAVKGDHKIQTHD